MIKYYHYQLLVNFSAVAIEFGFVLVVYSHFHAHYLTLMLPLPTFVGFGLFTSVAINEIGSISGIIIVHTVNDIYYTIVSKTFSTTWLFSVLFVDVYGYYLVRKAVADILDRQNSLNSSQHPLSHSPSTATRQANELSESRRPLGNTATIPASGHTQIESSKPAINYQDFLIKMRRFHITIVAASLFFIGMNIQAFLTVSHRDPIYPNPDEFHLNIDILYSYLILLLWAALTWWSWIPLDTLLDSASNAPSSNSTYMNNPDLDVSGKKRAATIEEEETVISVELPVVAKTDEQ